MVPVYNCKGDKGNLLRIMNRDGVFVTNEMDVSGVWKEHFENQHNIGSNEDVMVNVCVGLMVKEGIGILGMRSLVRRR